MLEEVKSIDLFNELMKRADGRALIELKQAQDKMLDAAIEAHDKAGQKLLDYLDEYFAEQAEFYQDRYGTTWWEAMKQDAPSGVVEDEKFKKLLYDFMELSVG